MSVPDEFDELIGLLRSPALPSELADEQRAIADMTQSYHSSAGRSSAHRSSAHQSSEEKIAMRNTSRRVRVGVLITTGIIGFGGVAAAGPGGVFDNGDASNEAAATTTTTTAATTTTTTGVAVATTTVAVTTTVAASTTTTLAAPETMSATVLEVVAEEAPAPPLVDDPETTFDETMCLEGNHGKTVSAVARGELVIAGIDVVDAAHSSCGKNVADEEVEEVEEVEPAETEDDAVEAPAKEKKNGNGNSGNGQANGRGRGKPQDD